MWFLLRFQFLLPYFNPNERSKIRKSPPPRPCGGWGSVSYQIKKLKFALNAKHFCVTKHIIKLTAVVACTTVLSDKSVRNPNHDLIFYLYFYLYSFDITNFMAKLISLAFLLNNVEPLTDANTNIF